MNYRTLLFCVILLITVEISYAGKFDYLSFRDDLYVSTCDSVHSCRICFDYYKPIEFSDTQLNWNHYIKDITKNYDYSDYVSNLRLTREISSQELTLTGYSNQSIEKNYTCLGTFGYDNMIRYGWCYYNNTLFNHSYTRGNIPSKTIWWNDTAILPYYALKEVIDYNAVTKSQIKNWIQNAPIGSNGTICIEGNVRAGATVDIYPEIFGYNYTEYALWYGNSTTFLSNFGSQLYLLEDNLATTNVVDYFNVFNGTSSANTNTLSKTAGKYDKGIDLLSTAYLLLQQGTYTKASETNSNWFGLQMWLNSTTGTSGTIFKLYQQASTDYWQFSWDGSGDIDFTCYESDTSCSAGCDPVTSLITNQFSLLTWLWDFKANRMLIWVNDTLVTNCSYTGDGQTNAYINLGHTGSTEDSIVGVMDNILIMDNSSSQMISQQNITDIFSGTIGDNIEFTNASNRSAYFFRNLNFTANITIVNKTSLDTIIFSTNANGSWINDTLSISVKPSANRKMTTTDNTISWYYWVNDTTGFSKMSEIYTFNITGSTLNVDNCSTNTHSMLNITFFDEYNLTTIPLDATLTYNLSFIEEGNTFSYAQQLVYYQNVYNFTLCSNLAISSPTIYYDITFGSSTYPQRSSTDTFSSPTQENLYSVYYADSLIGRLQAVDTYLQPISGVKCEMSKLFTDVYDVVEIETTDDSGIASFSVDTRITYLFTCTKSGYETNQFSIRITSSDTHTFQMSKETTTYQSLSQGITSYFFPNTQSLNNNTQYDFQFLLYSSYWNITNCIFFLKNSTTEFNQSSSTFNGSLCDITMSFNTGNQKYITAEAWYYLNGTKQSDFRIYSVSDNYQGDFSLMTVFDDINDFDGAGFNNSTRFILGLLFIIIVVGGISYKMEYYEPEVLIWTTCVLVFIISLVGWFSIPYTFPHIDGLDAAGEATWLSQWILFVLIFIISVGYSIRRHTE